MSKKMVGLLSAASAVASLSGAQAAASNEPDVRSLMEAHSFAELLTPIPNAVSVLRAMDQVAATMPAVNAHEASDTKVAQYFYHDHHHHHHGYWGRPWYHHHHHHHHSYWGPRRHHHHHHNSYYYYRY